jgi:hypothetical protein
MWHTVCVACAMAHLVQLLLPLTDNDGERFDQQRFEAVRRELTQRFGGVTAYMRSPATGLWKKESGAVDRDEVAIVEVMVETLDAEYWRDYRERLESAFGQQSLVCRAIAIEIL